MANMSASYLKRSQNPYETLERMLNKTTMSTQRVAHSNIVELGARMAISKADVFQETHDRELQEVLDEAEERATRELKASLKRLREEKDDNKAKALHNQKEYYEKLSKRVEEQRNRAEEERERELRKRLTREKEEALQQQWDDAERKKEEAVAVACESLTRKLRADFVYEKEQAVTEALRIAKEKYLIREQNAIEKTRLECEEKAKREKEHMNKLHQGDIERCNQRYNLLEKKWQREMDQRKSVEKDFRDLQDDYRRFMDYTDGMFHSDYLLQLRHLGKKLADKQLTEVTYEDFDRPLTDRVKSERSGALLGLDRSPEGSFSGQLPDLHVTPRREPSYLFRNK